MADISEWPLGSTFLVIHVSPGTTLAWCEARSRIDGDAWWTLSVGRCGGERAGVDLVLGTAPGIDGDGLIGTDGVVLGIRAGSDPVLDRAFARHGAGRISGRGAEAAGGLILSLPDILPHLADQEPSRYAEALLSVLRVLLRSGPDAVDGASAVDRARLRDRVERVIVRNVAAASLTPDRIASLARVSRTTLYRLFESDGGVASYVRRLRLDRVRSDLRDPDQALVPIAELAARRGLHCVASFNRSFRNAYGSTPSEVRAAALRDGTPTEAEGLSPEGAGRLGTAAGPRDPDEPATTGVPIGKTQSRQAPAGSQPCARGAAFGAEDGEE